MRRDDEMECVICETKFLIESYGCGRCPHCGMVHEWDEHYSPRLTNEVIKVIREHLLEDGKA
jgi:hypothetical protein